MFSASVTDSYGMFYGQTPAYSLSLVYSLSVATIKWFDGDTALVTVPYTGLSVMGGGSSPVSRQGSLSLKNDIPFCRAIQAVALSQDLATDSLNMAIAVLWRQKGDKHRSVNM